MIKVKEIKGFHDGYYVGIESMINDFLRILDKDKLIDIKYSTNHNNQTTALIIYKQPKEKTKPRVIDKSRGL
jgi:hypothetical protein